MQQCQGGSQRSTSIPIHSSATLASSPTIGGNNTVKFNKFGFPVDKKSGCISSKRGKLTKTFAPLCYKDWKLVPVEHNNDIRRELKDEYALCESQRKIQLKACGNSWKKLKNKLRKKVIDEYPDNLMKQKSVIPTGIGSEDWEKFCDYEATQEAKQARKNGAELRLKGPKSTHNIGRDGYAKIEEKMREESDDPLNFNPNRAEVWLKSHRRPDGSFSPEHADHAEKIIQLLQEFYDGKGGKMTLDNDPIALTFGIDKSGLVRGVGSGSRTTILSFDYVTSKLEKVDCERYVWIEKVKGLKDQIFSVETKVQETVKSQVFDFYEKLKGDLLQRQPVESVERTPATVPRSSPALGKGIRLCTILDHAK